MHRLQVAGLAQLLLAQLGEIKLRQQLSEQMQVPLQRRAQAIAREDAQRELGIRELHQMRRAAAALAVRFAGAPGDPRDRRQALERRHGLREETLGTRFFLQQLREHLQPALDRQADREEIARKEHAKTAAAARVPGEADQQHRRGGEEHRIGQRLEIVRAREGHEGEAAEDHHHQQQHQEHAVEEIDDLRAFTDLGLGGKEGNQHESKRQHVFGGAAGLGIDLAARRDLRQDRDREQREQIRQHHQVAAALPFGVMLVDLAADQPRDHHHPEGEQPPVEPQHHDAGHQRKDHALRRRDALLGAQERLPEQKQAEMREQQGARPRIGDAAKYGDVQ